MKTKVDLFIWKPCIPWRDIPAGWWTIKLFPHPALLGLPLEEWWKGRGFPGSDASVLSRLLQSCSTLCDPMDCSPPGSSVHGNLQVRILEWVAVSSSGGMHWQASSLTLAQPGKPTSQIYLEEKKGLNKVSEPHQIPLSAEYMLKISIRHKPRFSFSHFLLIFSRFLQWALGSTTTNKANGGDGIPVMLFQILKDGALKVLHSICQ